MYEEAVNLAVAKFLGVSLGNWRVDIGELRFGTESQWAQIKLVNDTEGAKSYDLLKAILNTKKKNKVTSFFDSINAGLNDSEILFYRLSEKTVFVHTYTDIDGEVKKVRASLSAAEKFNMVMNELFIESVQTLLRRNS